MDNELKELIININKRLVDIENNLTHSIIGVPKPVNDSSFNNWWSSIIIPKSRGNHSNKKLYAKYRLYCGFEKLERLRPDDFFKLLKKKVELLPGGSVSAERCHGISLRKSADTVGVIFSRASGGRFFAYIHFKMDGKRRILRSPLCDKKEDAKKYREQLCKLRTSQKWEDFDTFRSACLCLNLIAHS